MARIRSPYIDPTTMDFVYEDGTIRTDDTVHSCVLHALSLEKGSSAANPEGGNGVYALHKALKNVSDQAVAFCEEAVKHYIDDGVIGDFNAIAEVQGFHILAWEVSYEDTTERRLFFTLPTGVMSP